MKFIFYGSKPKNHKRIEQNYKNIKFAGWTNKNNIYSNVDLMLVPSIWEEPFGRVPVESIASNKWVIVSDKGGLPETINNEKKMIVNDVYNIDEWKEKINYFYNNTNICEKILEGKKEYIKKFALEKQGKKFQDLMEGLIS